MKKITFAPGCALMIYKPELAYRIHTMLKGYVGKMDMLTTCCRKDPEFYEPHNVINICPGCDKRYRLDYKSCSTISLWELLADSDFFPLPDYRKRKMTIIDACPTRDQERVHTAVRKLIRKMNITLVEPEKTREKSTCCGDTFYGELPVEKVRAQMIKKGSEMPVDDIVVYCISCSKSMFVAGKKPRYLIDLLFREKTLPFTFEPDAWHEQLKSYCAGPGGLGSLGLGL
ncbi:MAG TPA: heterodisulfide reductase-related iron-sulfur binding cluster [Bacteroidales bacterium]|nr:heterodisulfide reductase-related iron-sulfur binding cluster [Bacteroidales bacterium]